MSLATGCQVAMLHTAASIFQTILKITFVVLICLGWSCCPGSIIVVFIVGTQTVTACLGLRTSNGSQLFSFLVRILLIFNILFTVIINLGKVIHTFALFLFIFLCPELFQIILCHPQCLILDCVCAQLSVSMRK